MFGKLSLKKLRTKANLKETFPKVGFMSNEMKSNLEKLLGLKVKHTGIYEQALTHRSYLHVINSDYLSNERLEFLGDSILGMIVADYLFRINPNIDEGELTKQRSWIVNKNTLADCAKEIELDKFLMLSFSAAKSVETGSISIIADALEAMIGAIYIDRGFDIVKKFILKKLIPVLLQEQNMTDTNFKSILLEIVQSYGKAAPTYEVLEESGPDHNKEFVIGVYVDGEQYGVGNGKSKKEAEQAAAENAVRAKKYRSPINHENIIDL